MIWWNHINIKGEPFDGASHFLYVHVFLCRKKKVWEKIRFNEIYIGDDWKGNERWEKTGKEMEALGAKLVYLPYTKDTSSTMLREKLKEF